MSLAPPGPKPMSRVIVLPRKKGSSPKPAAAGLTSKQASKEASIMGRNM